jgi:hypothetical protein
VRKSYDLRTDLSSGYLSNHEIPRRGMAGRDFAFRDLSGEVKLTLLFRAGPTKTGVSNAAQPALSPQTAF